MLLTQTQHACDAVAEWVTHDGHEAIATNYTMNCEPYMMHTISRRRRYDSQFVGYGKNRASFHYKMAAQGMRLKVIPGLKKSCTFSDCLHVDFHTPPTWPSRSMCCRIWHAERCRAPGNRY